MWYNTYIAGALSTLLLVVVIYSTVALIKSAYAKGKNAVVQSQTLEDWAVLAQGESGSLELEQAWLRKVQELFTIFCMKQHDYGPTNIAVGGLKGIVLRSGDKLSRMWNLVGLSVKGGEAKETKVAESVRDSLLDWADYGIIGVLVVDGDWPLAAPEEVWGSEAQKEKGLV
jgi:hypothetical protein